MKDLNTKTINTALKDYYASKSLSGEQLDNLLMMQVSTNKADSFSSTTSRTVDTKTSWLHRFLPLTRNYRSAFYVTAFLFLASMFTVFSLLDREPASQPLSQRIMSEIVYNHNQDMPIEIASSSLTDISEYLNKLSFSIVLPNALSQPNWQLLGGRYCSINGKLAAQLKVKNLKDNSISTFYQAAIDKNLDKSDENAISDTIDGVGVSIWQEQGLLLGLAREKRTFLK